MSGFHTSGLGRQGRASVSLGSLMVMDIVHLTSATRFPCYWLVCFALQIFDFRVVGVKVSRISTVWHISSDTNDFVIFSKVLHTSPVPFLVC